jgi:hypothetical protein
MPPRSYFPDRPATSAERNKRYWAKRKARLCSLERIDGAPHADRRQADAQAALQRPPEQFGDWPLRLIRQRQRDRIDKARRCDAPVLAQEDWDEAVSWIPTRKTTATKRRVQATDFSGMFSPELALLLAVAEEGGFITPEIEHLLLEAFNLYLERNPAQFTPELERRARKDIKRFIRKLRT